MNTLDPREGDRYLVETPERIDLEYDVASLGSRLIAAMIDTLILTVVGAIIMFFGTAGMAVALALVLKLANVDDLTLGFWALGAGLLMTFAVIWGYFVFFELVWQGQSPGKRRMGLRVIKDGGYPIGFVDSAIRNLIRLVDFLPMYYVVGAMVMFVDRRSRRLGDLAAGTLVVKERRELKLESLELQRPAPLETSMSDKSDLSDQPDRPPPIPNLHRLTPADQTVLREYHQRRSTLTRPAAAGLAARLAGAFAARLECDLADEPPESFLARLAEQSGRRH